MITAKQFLNTFLKDKSESTNNKEVGSVINNMSMAWKKPVEKSTGAFLNSLSKKFDSAPNDEMIKKMKGLLNTSAKLKYFSPDSTHDKKVNDHIEKQLDYPWKKVMDDDRGAGKTWDLYESKIGGKPILKNHYDNDGNNHYFMDSSIK